MPWKNPTLRELVDACGGELSARLLDGAPLKPSSVLSVFATVRAGGEFNMYGYIDWAFKQIFVDKAEAEYLDAWAAVWGVARKEAVPAKGKAIASGLAGSGIPEGVLAKSQGGGFYVLAGAVMPEGPGDATAECPAEAQAPGKDGNLAAGAKLTLVSPIAGISSELVVAESGLEGGVDAEGDEAFRARLLKTIQNPPHGGSKTDYELWALEENGVENALCVPTYNGLGTVAVIVWGPPEDPILPDNVIEKAYERVLSRCPVTAGPGLLVIPPIVLAVDLRMRLSPDGQDVRDHVKEELIGLFAREALPGQVLPLSHIQEAISRAAGEYDHVLFEPTANVEPTFRQLPTVGTIDYESARRRRLPVDVFEAAAPGQGLAEAAGLQLGQTLAGRGRRHGPDRRAGP